MGEKQMKRIYSLMLSVFVAVSILSGIPFTNIDVNAAPKNQYLRKTNDLVKLRMPESVELAERTVTGTKSNVLGSTNYNNGVATGTHYNYLSDKARIIYRAFMAASSHVFAHGTDVDNVSYTELAPLAKYETAVFSVYDQDLQDAYEAVRYDHPDLLQLTMSDIQIAYEPVNYGNEIKYNTYLFLVSSNSVYDQAWFDQTTSSMKAKRTEFLSDQSITSASGVLGKELAIHDKLMSITTYDFDCVNNPDCANNPAQLGHTAYGALFRGLSVCDGYSMAYEYLLEGVGIHSMVIGGMADGGGHAWNIVKQSGQWYEVDVTWDDDDTISGVSAETEYEERHRFYHLTTAQISNYSYTNGSTQVTITRYRDGFSTNSPKATSTQYSWENIKTLLASGGDVQYVEVTGISIDPQTVKATGADIGTEGVLTATITPANATNKTLVFSSKNEQVVTVDENGRYRIVGTGSAYVTVSTYDGEYEASCLFTVSADDNAAKDDNIDYTGIFDGDGDNAENNEQETAIGDNISSSDKNYLVVSSDSVAVTKQSNKKVKKVKIGDSITYNGKTYKIVEIKANSYKKCKKLKTLSLGRNITKIGKGAFRGCKNLDKITVRGNSLSTIESGSFAGIKDGARITIICKNRKMFEKLVKKFKQAGANKAVFIYKKG
ncbi:Ig-like domain (group 2) [Butyrivibrio sp. ob235]|nr:Ig-like domain (group 2) [Butyrivibrio sp. ob235]